MKDIFWKDLLKFFFELKSKEKIPLNVDSIIWYNSSLKIEGKTLFYKELFDNQRLSRACIVHLVIKKTNWSYVKTMSCVILELRST